MDNHRNSNNTFGHQTITSSTTATLSPHHTFTSTHDDMGTWEKQAIPPVPPAVPPKQTPLHQGHDAPQPLSAYYTPHEYVDVNGMRNKAIIPANGFEKFSQHGHGGQPPATAKSSGGQGIYGMRRSTFVLVVALVVVVAVAIGLGVGLGVGLKKTGGGGGRDGAQQSQITTSVSPSLTIVATSATASPQPTSANGRAPTTATTTTTVTLALPSPLASTTSQSKLTCPTSNSTLLTSPFTSSNQAQKYQILCDANLFASSSSPSSKQNLAGPLRAIQTLEQCWGVCDGMNFFLGRKDVAAVWNYIDGPAKGDCWCIAGPQTGEGQLRVVGNDGVGVVVRPWDG
ncbi:unnamed protein product [Sordaria macrospora k-hell]|uniref:WGS project CABT00000000 data, contig 2.22 n=1 Tax=Sordaria macrospora (strain ATCC MYA-333 / DSM 997 / K(L3346) / K-hell) TaxID=771870 RepID=F7W2L2_SORMK|nr:uncharacterized protein SMAC_05075 [Sordaria macrospora k-hell]CCC11863.1 unnamed protein product [Sordaria macrospora k-hell]